MLASKPMLTLAHRGTYPQLMGLFGTSEVENLQRALINLSVATQRPAINCQVTGTMDDQTMTAINAALGLLTEELPSWLYLGLQAALIAGSTSTTVKKYAGQYATQLTIAANTAAIKYKKAPTTTPPATPPATTGGMFAPGWYKTPMGIAIIAVGAFVGYKLFLEKK